MTAKFRSKRASSLPHNSGPVPAKLAWGWPFIFAESHSRPPQQSSKSVHAKRPRYAPRSRGPHRQKFEVGLKGGVPQQVREVPHATVSRHRASKGSRPMNATEIAAALSTRAEDVCRRYLPRGRRQGRYWTSRRHKRRQRALALRAPGSLQAYPENGPMPRPTSMAICSISSVCAPTEHRCGTPWRRPSRSSHCRGIHSRQWRQSRRRL